MTEAITGGDFAEERAEIDAIVNEHLASGDEAAALRAARAGTDYLNALRRYS